MAEMIPVGLVFSVTGPYSAVSRAMLNGALLAIDEVKADSAYDFILEPKLVDPKGELAGYRGACEMMLKQDRIRHVIGCYTSSSRKEVIPSFEKYDALLWYPSHYEGFETSSNVIYTGASPNQHIIPLAKYMMKAYGKRTYCVGSNYIWAWESNRILREVLTANGGDLVSEKYIPVGSEDVDHLISDIERERPDFIFSTLIGDSRYAFVKAYQCRERNYPASRADSVPITDCSLSEPELLRIGPAASPGLIASSVYFQSIESERNARFIASYQARFGADTITCADAEASYISVLLLANALQRAGTTGIDAIRRAALGSAIVAPQGRVTIDADNAHCYLTPRLARALNDRQFEVFAEAPEPVKPDPYLVWLDPAQQGEGIFPDPAGLAKPERKSLLRLVK